jgi:hypothetical protein
MNPRKIVLDSRFSKVDGINNPPSRWTVQFPTSCEYLGEATRLYIGQFALSQTLPSIHATCNTIYLSEYDTALGYASRAITLPDGNYDKTELVALLTTFLNAGAPRGSYTVVEANNRLTIAITGGPGASFRIWGMGDLRNPLFGDVWVFCGGVREDLDPEINAARVLGVRDSFDPSLDYPSLSGPTVRTQTTLVCDHLDVRGVTTVYVSIPELARDDFLVPYGETGVVKKVPVTESFGGLLQSTHSGIAEDYVQIGVTRFRSLTVRLLDCYGVELRGLQGYCSMVLVIDER